MHLIALTRTPHRRNNGNHVDLLNTVRQAQHDVQLSAGGPRGVIGRMVTVRHGEVVIGVGIIGWN